MPRPQKPVAPGPNSVVASAARINGQRQQPKSAQAKDWQAEAWEMRDTVGELRFADAYLSNALSRVRLYVRETLPDGTQREVAEGLPAEALAALFYGEEGQGQMLASMGSHFTVPGETWLVGLTDPAAFPETDPWRVLSNEEVRLQGDYWEVERGDGEQERYRRSVGPEGQLPEALVIRIWRSHPRKAVEADSPVRAALPILRELRGLTQHVGASIDSRLAGAGILLLPAEMTFSTPEWLAGAEPEAGEATEAPSVLTVDEFTAVLTEAMLTPISDRGNASAHVPLIVKAPGAVLEHVKHLRFSTDLDAKALDLRAEAIRRLALSMDLPPEVLLGQSDSNHWSAWQISEDAIKLHVVPVVELITHGLTTRYLWPALQGDSDTLDPALRRFTIEGDTSELRQRPQRSTEAMALHKDLRITDDALLRETGFGREDLLDPASEEYRRRTLENVASGVTTADLTSAALAQLGITLVPKPSEVTAAPGTGTASGPQAVAPPPVPPAVEAPRNPPTPPAAAVVDPHVAAEAQGMALLVGSEATVLRALERANNRVGKRGRGPRRQVRPDQLDAALQGAWEYVPRAAALCGVDPDRLTHALDTYTRGLLVTGADHDPVRFQTMLRERVLAARALEATSG